MNGTSHEVSIFCSTHFYHLLVLANFPCEIKEINKYNNKLKNFYPWIHYHDHIELHLEFQHWTKFFGDDLLLLMILLTAVALKRYIERIHPLPLRYRNTFCCYTLLTDVFPWSPNQFDTSMGLFAIIGWSGSLFSKIGWLSQCFRLEFIHSCITCLLTPAKLSRIPECNS